MFTISALTLLVLHLHALLSFASLIPTSAPEDARRTPILSFCEARDCKRCADAVPVFAPVGSEPQCYLALPSGFASARVHDPHGVLSPGAVEVSPGNCTDWLELPLSGVCYNVNGPVPQYTQWGFNNID